jgi:hypothetical protein
MQQKFRFASFTRICRALATFRSSFPLDPGRARNVAVS